MDDELIVDLFWRRSEDAIKATAEKYGGMCRSVAYSILRDSEDAEESVSDTYMAAWNSIPPHRPSALPAFLVKLTRHISIDMLRSRTRKKRGGDEYVLALDELSESIPAPLRVEDAAAADELREAIDVFLAGLGKTERDVFLCRYWFFASVSEIADSFGFSRSKVKSMLLRTRKKLRAQLEKEGLI